MSSRNGDRSRFHRVRKQKIARRIRTLALVHPSATPVAASTPAKPRPVTA
jgi:hypothetical protein